MILAILLIASRNHEVIFHVIPSYKAIKTQNTHAALCSENLYQCVHSVGKSSTKIGKDSSDRNYLP